MFCNLWRTDQFNGAKFQSVRRLSQYRYFIDKQMKKSREERAIQKRSIDWKAVGRRIRELRGFDITQQEFARGIGVSQSYLSAVEHGGVEIGAEILVRISQKFGKSVEWLLMGSTGRKKP